MATKWLQVTRVSTRVHACPLDHLSMPAFIYAAREGPAFGKADKISYWAELGIQGGPLNPHTRAHAHTHDL